MFALASLRFLLLQNPHAGAWTVTKIDIGEWDVEVTAKSTVDFTAKLLKSDPSRFSFFELAGKPIPG